jgi:hypothetical protein
MAMIKGLRRETESYSVDTETSVCNQKVSQTVIIPLHGTGLNTQLTSSQHTLRPLWSSHLGPFGGFVCPLQTSVIKRVCGKKVPHVCPGVLPSKPVATMDTIWCWIFETAWHYQYKLELDIGNIITFSIQFGVGSSKPPDTINTSWSWILETS